MWSAEFTSPGACSVQVSRREAGALILYGRIAGMDWVPLRSWSGFTGTDDVLLELGYTRGLEMRLESAVPIVECKVLASDGTVSEAETAKQEVLTIMGEPLMVDSENELLV